MIAAQEGQHECLSILLTHGAEVDKCREVSAVCFSSSALDFDQLAGEVSAMIGRDAEYLSAAES